MQNNLKDMFLESLELIIRDTGNMLVQKNIDMKTIADTIIEFENQVSATCDHKLAFELAVVVSSDTLKSALFILTGYYGPITVQTLKSIAAPKKFYGPYAQEFYYALIELVQSELANSIQEYDLNKICYIISGILPLNTQYPKQFESELTIKPDLKYFKSDMVSNIEKYFSTNTYSDIIKPGSDEYNLYQNISFKPGVFRFIASNLFPDNDKLIGLTTYEVSRELFYRLKLTVINTISNAIPQPNLENILLLKDNIIKNFIFTVFGNNINMVNEFLDVRMPLDPLQALYYRMDNLITEFTRMVAIDIITNSDVMYCRNEEIALSIVKAMKGVVDNANVFAYAK